MNLLRLKNPKLYERIKYNQDMFFINEEVLALDEEKKIVQENFKKFMDENKEFQEILILLFPTLVEDEFGNVEKSRNKDHKNKYLSDPYYLSFVGVPFA